MLVFFKSSSCEIYGWLLRRVWCNKFLLELLYFVNEVLDERRRCMIKLWFCKYLCKVWKFFLWRIMCECLGNILVFLIVFFNGVFFNLLCILSLVFFCKRKLIVLVKLFLVVMCNVDWFSLLVVFKLVLSRVKWMKVFNYW